MQNTMAAPLIIGKRICLHPLRLQDIPLLNKWRNALDTRALLMLHPYPVPLEQDLIWYEEMIVGRNDRQAYFGISLQETDTLVGYCNVMDINRVHGTCTVGAHIQEEQQRQQGIGLEAAVLLMEYVFTTMGLRRIAIYIADGNRRALQFNRILGYTDEGVMRSHIFMNGSYHDVHVLGLLSQEYFARRQQLFDMSGLSR